MIRVINKFKNARTKFKYRWKHPFYKVQIPSSIDSKIQKAYFYSPDIQHKRPLLVSLHSWAGGYNQVDPTLSRFCVENNWNYIHPDFRGENTTPEAAGSDLSMSDINDAISYALDNGNVDTENIFIAAASGGAYAGLCYSSVAKHPINSYILWSPITDLVAWHDQSVIRKSRYKDDILACTNSSGSLDVEEAQKRSPLYRDLTDSNSKFFIHTGYHDGYDHYPVPVDHSLNFFNKYVVKNGGTENDLVSKDDIIDLLSKEVQDTGRSIQGRAVYYTKVFKNAQVTVFEGAHSHIEEHTTHLLNENSSL